MISDEDLSYHKCLLSQRKILQVKIEILAFLMMTLSAQASKGIPILKALHSSFFSLTAKWHGLES